MIREINNSPIIDTQGVVWLRDAAKNISAESTNWLDDAANDIAGTAIAGVSTTITTDIPVLVTSQPISVTSIESAKLLVKKNGDENEAEKEMAERKKRKKEKKKKGKMRGRRIQAGRPGNKGRR